MGSSFKDCLRSWLVGIKLILLFVVYVIGLAILGFTVYVLLEPEMQAILRGTGKIEIFNAVVFTFVFIGFFTVVGSLIGCSGAYHENECLLTTYFIIMIIIFSVHFIAAILGHMKMSFLLDNLENTLRLGLARQSPRQQGELQYLDIIQMKLKCCGAQGPGDYVSFTPMSCCNPEITSCSSIDLNHLFNKGCNPIFRAHMEKWINIFCIISGSIATVEVLSTFLTMLMCCTVHSYRKGEYYGVDYQ